MDAKTLLMTAAGRNGWTESTQIDVLCQFVDDADVIDALESFLQDREDTEFELDDDSVCERCESPLDGDGLFCTDLSCPFSDHLQTCPKGWVDHPEYHGNVDVYGPPICACRLVKE